MKLVAATGAHVNRLAKTMRAIDAAECRAFRREPKSAIRYSLGGSLHAITAVDDEQRPLAMFGVVPTGLMTRTGTPWFLGTDAVFDYPRALLSMGPGIIRWWQQDFDVMENYVGAENDRAIRLLKKWGAVVDPETLEIGDMPFHHFQFTRAIQA